MKTIFLLSLIAATALFAQDLYTNLPVITVTASAQTPETAAIHDVLEAAPGVVLNTQGGSQNDLSIRGSSFSGAGLSLGGLALRNPQTEHFHAELPLPATMLSRPEVQTGLNNQGGHLVGNVGFDFLPNLGKKQFEAGYGSDHRNWQSLLIQHALTNGIGLGVFAGRESAEGVDYGDNDLERAYGGGHLQFRDDDTQIDVLAAHQQKEFGARGYYGVTAALPADEKTEDTLLFLSARRGDLNADYLRGGVSWHQFRDDYRLPSIGYRNQHRSRISSAFFDGRTLEVNGWSLGGRVDLEAEHLASTGSQGLGFRERSRTGLSLLPRWRGGRLSVTIGARGEVLTDDADQFLPQLGAEYALSDNLSAFSSYTETVRPPSYTELYYISPASAGNTDLRAQTAKHTEIGFRGVPSESMDWEFSAFHRQSRNTIDWVKTNATARWEAADIGTLDVYGAEADVGWYPAQNLDVRFTYTWICKNRTPADLGAYSSRYALDYPEHLAQVSLLWRPFQTLEIGTVQAVRMQSDNPVRQNDDTEFDGSLIARFNPPQINWATLSLLIRNLWDDDFQSFPGQQPMERSISVVFSTDF